MYIYMYMNIMFVYLCLYIYFKKNMNARDWVALPRD